MMDEKNDDGQMEKMIAPTFHILFQIMIIFLKQPLTTLFIKCELGKNILKIGWESFGA